MWALVVSVAFPPLDLSTQLCHASASAKLLARLLDLPLCALRHCQLLDRDKQDVFHPAVSPGFPTLCSPDTWSHKLSRRSRQSIDLLTLWFCIFFPPHTFEVPQMELYPMMSDWANVLWIYPWKDCNLHMREPHTVHLLLCYYYTGHFYMWTFQCCAP